MKIMWLAVTSNVIFLDQDQDMKDVVDLKRQELKGALMLLN